MAESIRLDKYLADMGIGTRSDVKVWIRKKRVKINGELCRAADTKVTIATDEISFDGAIINYSKFVYYMLNKPVGVVSATKDNVSKTVLDLFADKLGKDVFPVGRLDKDTEGMLLITNDGELAHQLLSPKKHVAKVYYAKVMGKVTEEDQQAFLTGVKLEEDFITLPAKLTILRSEDISEIELTIHEGKFHQVKRMFEAVGKEVIFLKRLSMGGLLLDPQLAPGEYRKLTDGEINYLKSLNSTGKN